MFRCFVSTVKNVNFTAEKLFYSLVSKCVDHTINHTTRMCCPSRTPMSSHLKVVIFQVNPIVHEIQRVRFSVKQFSEQESKIVVIGLLCELQILDIGEKLNELSCGGSHQISGVVWKV